MSKYFPDGLESYGETVTEIELTVTATIQQDFHAESPWDASDGHGAVSDWTKRAKQPGELVLADHRGYKRFYDFAGACRTALADGWNAAPYEIPGETPRQRAARAARADFEFLRGWCNDEWHYCGVIVSIARDGEELASASLWGIESNAGDYLADTAEELAAEAMAEALSKV